MNPFIIINGFDRSGTTSITRTFANHDKVELIMHPFNSGFIRTKMYEVFGRNESIEIKQARLFFNDLKMNKINQDLINSHWFYEHSTTLEYKPSQLHVLKTTINHLSQKWMIENFPEIHIWGIWRDPRDIVSSILRNGYYGKWYKDAINSIKATVESVDFLRDNYLHVMNSLNSDLRIVSFLIAVRTHFFLYYLDHDKLINYENFKRNANTGLNPLCKYYNLKTIDFIPYAKTDLNLTGISFSGKDTFFEYNKSEIEFMNSIFIHIEKIKNCKFGNDKIS